MHVREVRLTGPEVGLLQPDTDHLFPIPLVVLGDGLAAFMEEVGHGMLLSRLVMAGENLVGTTRLNPALGEVKAGLSGVSGGVEREEPVAIRHDFLVP
jgi:hypothetical protein